MHTRIRNGLGFFVEPTFGFLSLLIFNLIRSVLIPIVGLLGVRVRNLLLINPVLGLLVLRVVDLLGRVHGRVEVLEEVATLDLVAVDEDLESVVRAAGALSDVASRRVSEG